jgi:hypothetical protein
LCCRFERQQTKITSKSTQIRLFYAVENSETTIRLLFSALSFVILGGVYYKQEYRTRKKIRKAGNPGLTAWRGQP